jgi:hypothetical protein
MNLNFIREIYDALRTHIDFNEHKDAADTLVNLLIDNNFEVEEIKESFHGEKDVLLALKYYQAEHDSYQDDDEDHEEYYQDEDEW